MGQVEARLHELGITLPKPAAPVANYVPFVRSGALVTISGQLCFGPDGKLAPGHVGLVGDEVAPEAAREAARLCAINLLAQLKAAIGDLDLVLRCIRLGGTADPMPTLADVIGRIGGRTPLVVEIKSRFDGDERLTRRTVEIVSGCPHPVAVKSFDPAIVSLLRRIAPSLPRGIVAQSHPVGGEWDRLDDTLRHAMAHLLHWGETEPDFISWHHADLPNASTFLPRRLARVPVMTWTIRSAADAHRALAHADQIVFEGFRPS